MCLRGAQGEHIFDVSRTVKLICNNKACTHSRFMHSECFEVWQNNLLSQLNKTKEGQKKLRNWSEKQKLQNLWKQQGYNLVIDACHCKCGEGSLRKDLNWVPPKPTGSGRLTGQWIQAVIQAQILLNICQQDQTVTARSRREGERRATRTASRR